MLYVDVFDKVYEIGHTIMELRNDCEMQRYNTVIRRSRRHRCNTRQPLKEHIHLLTSTKSTDYFLLNKQETKE